MVWSWITQLVPLADGIIGAAKSVVNAKKRKKKIEDRIKEKVIALYKKNFGAMNRDLTLLRGWKPIIAKIQAVDIILRRWEHNSSQSKWYNDPKIVLSEASIKNIKKLDKILIEVEEKMNELKDEAELNWSEGGPILYTSLENLQEGMTDLIQTYRDYKGDTKGQIEAIQFITQRLQQETKDFFSFWDGFMKSLFDNSKSAANRFYGELTNAAKETITIIQNEYPTESWGSVLSDVLGQIQTVKENIETASNNEEE